MKKIILILFLGISLVGCGPSDPEGQFEKAMEYFEKVRNNTSWESEKQKLNANANAYKWLNKAIEQGYKPAIEELEKIKAKEEEELKAKKAEEEAKKAEEEASRLAEEREKELARIKAEEKARKIAEAEEREYDYIFSCSHAVEKWNDNALRAKNNWTDKKIVITGIVKKIDTSYVELSASKWTTLDNVTVETQTGSCQMNDLTNNGMSYAASLNKLDNARFVCKGGVFDWFGSVVFYNCSEYKY